MSKWQESTNDRITIEIPTNQDNAEAFVYEWTNRENGKKYLGIKKSPEAGVDYITSSKDEQFLKDLHDDNIKWTYKVILWAGYKFCQQYEYNELTKVNAKDNDKYYNKSNGFNQFIEIVRHPLMKNIADTITSTCNFADCSQELKDKNYMNNTQWLQVRDETTDDVHEKVLKDKINESFGKYATEELLCTILENRLVDGKLVNLGVNGNHSNNAFKSSNATSIRTLIIPEHIHKDWYDEEIEWLGRYLNPREKTPKKETNLTTIAQGVYKEIEKGLSYNSESIQFVFKENHLTQKEINKIKQLVSDMTGEDKNWINWQGAGYKKQLQTKIDTLNLKPNIYAKQFSSGKNDLITNGLVKIKELIESGKKIDTYHVVLYHPSESYQEKWHKEYDPLNKEILKNVFEYATDKSIYKGITFIIEEMETEKDKWDN